MCRSTTSVPPLSPAVPKGINIHISFEEALKLLLGLGYLLTRLNGYDRNTKEGRASCVNLCVFTDLSSITINQGKLRAKKKEPKNEPPKKKELESLLKEYLEEVDSTNLEPLTKQTYKLHARNFVRWVQGDFEPGSRKG